MVFLMFAFTDRYTNSSEKAMNQDLEELAMQIRLNK
jgi:hypothetical protein